MRAGRFELVVGVRRRPRASSFFATRRNSTTSANKVQQRMTDLILILTTMPDDDRADRLARALIDERLAACVNVHGPMVSSYRWKGAVEREAERQLVIKTTRARQ